MNLRAHAAVRARMSFPGVLPHLRSAAAPGLVAALLTCLVAGAQAAGSAPPAPLRLEAQGVVLELTAPRADIVRVRAGRGALAEDASWAVLPEHRAASVPWSVQDEGRFLEASTPALRVRIEKSTLRLRVADAAGHVLLEDCVDDALSIRESRVALRKQAPSTMHYFGLGDKAGPLDRAGQSFSLWNTDAYGFSPTGDPLYKSIPFVLGVDDSGASFGFFFDNTWRSWFDFGRTEPGVLSVGANGGAIDYYVMAGPAPRDVVQSYAWLTGTAPLPPLWSLGFQQSRYSYKTEPELRAVADRLRADHIPADVLYLDIDYQDRNRPFTVNPAAYPDLRRLMGELRAMGLRAVLITDLHIARAPNEGYAPYDTGAAGGYFVENPDGTTYVGPVWPGPSVFPDFSRPVVRQWWGGLYQAFVQDGVAGFWNDMNEPALFETPTKTMPLDVLHTIAEPGFAPRRASHAEMHNVYGMLNSRATFEGLEKLAPDQRPFVLTRASYAGGQRYAATWTGDNTSSWAHLTLSVSQLANLGLSGFTIAGDDIGGFAGNAPSADLLTRWIEVGAFNPVFRDHTANDKPPQEVWVHGPEHEAIRRHYIEERYRLLPYLYTLAEEASRTGLPILRPVVLEFPQAAHASGPGGRVANDFLLGPDLWIAPPDTWESPAAYPVELPGPGWFDYWTGERLAQAKTTETPRLERLPVYVRPGAILPRQPLVQSTAETPRGALTLEVYPGPDCTGSLYLDDGLTQAYRHGAFLRQRYSCSVEADGTVQVRIEKREGAFHPWWNSIEVVVHGWSSANPRAVVAGKTLPAQVDASGQRAIATVADSGGDITLRVSP